MIGSCCAAMISVGFGVEALSIGVGGLPGILSIKPEYYLIFLLAMVVAVVIPFTLTFIVGRIKTFFGRQIRQRGPQLRLQLLRQMQLLLMQSRPRLRALQMSKS